MAEGLVFPDLVFMTIDDLVSAWEYIGDRKFVVLARQDHPDLDLRCWSDESWLNFNEVKGTINENGDFVASDLTGAHFAGYPIQTMIISPDHSLLKKEIG